MSDKSGDDAVEITSILMYRINITINENLVEFLGETERISNNNAIVKSILNSSVQDFYSQGNKTTSHVISWNIEIAR